MPRVFTAVVAAALVLSSTAQSPAEEPATLRAWVAQMKTDERGPFSRIRWFCKDGTVLPPDPFACQAVGGGSQHGEWNSRVKQMREAGYHIANVFADLNASEFVQTPAHPDILNQMIIEQFLIGVDDGWILRRARYYRGALQEEDERLGARRLLYKIAEDPNSWRQRYLQLSRAAALLAHGSETADVSKVRQLSMTLGAVDREFTALRNKIHARPDAGDAMRVREYSASREPSELGQQYAELARTIEGVYSSRTLNRRLTELLWRSVKLPPLHAVVERAQAVLEETEDAGTRFAATADLMMRLRERVLDPNGPALRIAILDTILAAADEHFVAATSLRERLDTSSRRELITWLLYGSRALYGVGVLSARQREALEGVFTTLNAGSIGLATYKPALDYAGLVPGWGSQQFRFYFYAAMQELTTIEPLAALFIQDQLRASPMFFYAQVLQQLRRDANRLAGVKTELLGEEVGTGLRALNPGLAKGILYTNPVQHDFDQDGIYLLPETISELPPVAGIVTAGEGNPLSHVQLLARNLGIPNVAIDEALIPRLQGAQGKRVVLAAGSSGSVQLVEYSEAFEPFFNEQANEPQTLIRPDLVKLDVKHTQLIALSELRAHDSGRTVGPKAAKLGELRHHYPAAVADGLAIPFGVFRKLLDQPYHDSGGSVFEWVVAQYEQLAKLPTGSAQRKQATTQFRQTLQDWIRNADPGQQFRDELRDQLAAVFGADDSYGVFVRSDTNVEDLPGFTGAGLNLTVPNVVGFEAIVVAVSRVWASPFSARAFAWRQAHMEQPQHVYPAVLLLRSVPAEKSGVMVTRDIDSGKDGWLSVAVNEGVGGAVDGQGGRVVADSPP